MWRRQSQRMRRRRKSAARPGNLRRQRRPPAPIRHAPLCGGDGVGATKNAGETGDSDSVYDSDGERRLSGEMISMKDFLQANKVTIYSQIDNNNLLQKHSNVYSIQKYVI